MKRSLRKKELKAARKARQRDPDVKRGFRKLVLNGNQVWQWRSYGERVEIRVPGTLNLKWMVPVWRLQGHESREAWEEPHKDCFDECVVTGDLGCGRWTVTPGMVKAYIDGIRQATS